MCAHIQLHLFYQPHESLRMSLLTVTSIALEIVTRGVVSHLADPTVEIQMMGMNGDQICCASIAISTSEASKPTLSSRSAQPVEPNSSHLLEARIIRVQRIA